MATRNKLTRIKKCLQSEGWHVYPRTFAALVDMAADYADTSDVTAKQAAIAAIKMYQQRSAGYTEGAGE